MAEGPEKEDPKQKEQERQSKRREVQNNGKGIGEDRRGREAKVPRRRTKRDRRRIGRLSVVQG